LERLERFVPAWVPVGRNQVTKEINAILREYILILANSGNRPGTEASNIRWRHVQRQVLRDGTVMYRFFIDKKGKTRKKRTAVAHRCVGASLDRLRELNGGNPDPDSFVFAVPSTSRTPCDIQGAFERLLRDSGLMYDPIYKEKRTPYCLRNYYITEMRRKGVGYETLAKQCGTSVAMLEKYYKVQPEDEAAIPIRGPRKPT
jgi:integrase